MEVSGLDETLKVLGSSLSHIKWRLRSSTKRRLETDVLALCTGMRPVVMVDYGGKMPELQERLCALLQTCQKESPIFEHLRIMVIEDMIYLVHENGLAEYVRSTLNLELGLLLVDLEPDPPKMIAPDENSLLGMELISVQKQFCSSYPLNGMNKDLVLSCHGTDSVADAKPLINECNTSQSSKVIDLSSCMQETQVTIPTLNGWLLGYPLVYLFGKEHIADAIYNLSTKSLRIYKILICRNVSSDKATQQDELMSFSVPYDLSMGGSDEPWAKAFLSHMQAKWEKCKPFWKSLEMEVSECYPQAIAL